MTKRRAVLMIVFAWICGFTPALPLVVGSSTWMPGVPCLAFFVLTDLHSWMSAVLVLLILGLVISAYVLIIKTTRQQFKNITKLSEGSSFNINSRQKLNLGVLKTCSMVIAFFTLAYIPIGTSLILNNFYTTEEMFANPVYVNVSKTVSWVCGMNSGINPVIYALKMPQFRKAIAHLFTSWARKG